MKNSAHTTLQHQIDRLVDGELNEAERRTLLSRLEQEPDGWRECALTFLESQAWRESLGWLVEPAHSATMEPSPSRQRRTREASRIRVIVRWLGLAVGLLLAFGLGLGAGVSSKLRDVADIAIPQPAPVDGTVEHNAAKTGASLRSSPGHPKGKTDEPEPVREPVNGNDDTVRVVGLVRFSDEGTEQYTVPILSGPGLDEQWLAQQPPPLSDYELHQLEQHGYRVTQNRRVMSVELADGSRLAIPLNTVGVQYVGQRVY